MMKVRNDPQDKKEIDGKGGRGCVKRSKFKTIREIGVGGGERGKEKLGKSFSEN